ncbi:unnamed protein product [Closterium sp. NIES-54]
MSNGVRASKPLVSAAASAAARAAAAAATQGRRGASSWISEALAPPAEASHLFGIPRRVAIATITSMSYFYMNVLNRMEVTNQQTLLDLVNSRPAGTPLITVSNHMATYDWLQPAHPRTRRSRSPALPLSRFSAPPLPLFHSPALPLSRTSRPRPSPRPLPQPLSLFSHLGGLV